MRGEKSLSLCEAMSLRSGTIALLALAFALSAIAGCREADEPTVSAADLASFSPQPTPEKALRAYMKLLELRVKDPNLALFTPETRRLRVGASSTDFQQENELRSLRPAIGTISVRRRENLAVIRFASEHRKVPPYFFRRGGHGWMLDLATPRRVLVFDHANDWAFRSRDHEFAFAFDDG